MSTKSSPTGASLCLIREEDGKGLCKERCKRTVDDEPGAAFSSEGTVYVRWDGEQFQQEVVSMGMVELKQKQKQ